MLTFFLLNSLNSYTVSFCNIKYMVHSNPLNNKGKVSTYSQETAALHHKFLLLGKPGHLQDAENYQFFLHN